MKMSEVICSHPGCTRGPVTTGHTILRTSAKGSPFAGRCAEHYGPGGSAQAAADEAAVERTYGGRCGPNGDTQ